MLEEKTEQDLAPQEPVVETLPEAETPIPASEAEATTSEKLPETPVSIFETPEFKKAVERTAKSIADKSTATYQRTIAEKEAEISRIKAEKQQEDEQKQFTARQETESIKWREDGVPENTIQNYHQAEAELNSRIRNYYQSISLASPKLKSAEGFEAAYPVLKEVLDDATFGLLTEVIEAVKDAETPRERAALARIKGLEIKARKVSTPAVTPPKPPIRRGDSGLPNASGGDRLTPERVAEMSPEERWKRRVEIDRMEMNIS